MRVEQIGDCTLYLADCIDVLPTLGDYDAMITDPPYLFQAQGGGIGARRDYIKFIEKKDINDGFDFNILPPNKSWACFCSKAQIIDLLQTANNQKSKKWALLTWNKPDPTPLCGGNYLPDTEYIVHSHVPGGIYGDYADKARFIVCTNEGGKSIAHPTAKPIAVMRKIIATASTRGHTVLDPFMGSGTTGVACVKMGRKFIGIEREPEYFEIAVKRIREAYAQPDMFIEQAKPMKQDSFL
jgi:DNA modification methylase